MNMYTLTGNYISRIFLYGKLHDLMSSFVVFDTFGKDDLQFRLRYSLNAKIIKVHRDLPVSSKVSLKDADL